MAIDATDPDVASTSRGIPSGSHAVPVIPNFSHSLPARPSGSLPAAGTLFKKKRVLRHSSNSDKRRQKCLFLLVDLVRVCIIELSSLMLHCIHFFRLNSVLCGKRKRSLRDRSRGDCDMSMHEDGK